MRLALATTFVEMLSTLRFSVYWLSFDCQSTDNQPLLIRWTLVDLKLAENGNAKDRRNRALLHSQIQEPYLQQKQRSCCLLNVCWSVCWLSPTFVPTVKPTVIPLLCQLLLVFVHKKSSGHAQLEKKMWTRARASKHNPGIYISLWRALPNKRTHACAH